MTESTDLVRVGLIGHGRSGSIIHAPLIEGTPGYRITAVSSSNAASAQIRRDAPRVYATPAELIATADVDLAVIATPNDTHARFATDALLAGKHVVIDKPFAPSVRETQDLFLLARQVNRTITSFQNRRWDGDFVAVRDAIASNLVGEIFLFEAYWDRFRPMPPAAWRNSADRGAGVLWDLGPHMIDQALLLFGPPEMVWGDVQAQRPGAEADDYFHITLAYGSMRCILSASSVVAAARPRFALHGSAGSLIIRGLDPTEDALIAGQRPSSHEFRTHLPDIKAELITAMKRHEVTYPPGEWTGFYSMLRKSLIRADRFPVTEEQVTETIKLIEFVYGLRSEQASGYDGIINQGTLR